MSLTDDIKTYAARRGKEIRELAGSELTLDSVEANLGGQKIKFRANVERLAAWELYVELNTRVATQELGEDEGFLRETLSSLHTIFGVTREILKKAGPGVAVEQESLGHYAMAVLNRCLRPFLSKWHPLLADWESTRAAQKPRSDHEREWDRSRDMRKELAKVREVLLGYSEALALLAGIREEAD